MDITVLKYSMHRDPLPKAVRLGTTTDAPDRSSDPPVSFPDCTLPYPGIGYTYRLLSAPGMWGSTTQHLIQMCVTLLSRYRPTLLHIGILDIRPRFLISTIRVSSCDDRFPVIQLGGPPSRAIAESTPYAAFPHMRDAPGGETAAFSLCISCFLNSRLIYYT